MKEVKMSIKTKQEILIHIQKRYKAAKFHSKSKILDEFVATTGYCRKYAISKLNQVKQGSVATPVTEALRRKKAYHKKYDEEIKQVLLTIWYAANQICSKRLVPFIPELMEVLERFGHIVIPTEIRSRLLTISPATVDRMLKTSRKEVTGGISTTRPGSLLKKQIKVRTFTDWNDIIPGFFEGDLVAHCGGRMDGSFLNSFVLTDIASGWTEFFVLLKKGEADVIAALGVLQQLLPFPLLGLDTDNGSEFINHGLLAFCTNHKITFTRSRAYKKNDQAHVEEKNGSIVRRLIGYDRFEGIEAYNALSELYATLRLYVNFFQPSLKLISKTREAAKVTKKYDKAKTPYQRLLLSPNLSEEVKTNLKNQYEKLDPIALLKNLERLQNNFWQHAWKEQTEHPTTEVNIKTVPYINDVPPEIATNIASVWSAEETTNVNIQTAQNEVKKKQVINIKAQKGDGDQLLPISANTPINLRRYKLLAKQNKRRIPRWWRTRPDDFSNVWDRIVMQLNINPTLTVKVLLEDLIKDNPDQFSLSKLRTLQKRVANWRKEQIKINQEHRYYKSLTEDNEVSKYISLVAHSIING